MQEGAGSGLSQVIAVCAAAPTVSGRNIWIRRCVDRANSPFCIDCLATACVPNRIDAVFHGPQIMGIQQRDDSAIAGL
jgi:hypothetical protein